MRKAIVALTVATMIFIAGAWISISQEAVKSDAFLRFKDQGEYWGFMDRSGKVVIPAKYDDVRPFFEGIALVWEDVYPQYIDRNQKIIWYPQVSLNVEEDEFIRFQMDLGNFCEGLARVTEKGLFGFIEKTGRYAIKPQFLSAGNFSAGLAWAEAQNGVGFIRKDGTFAIKPQYDSAGSFSGGLAPVMLGEKWGYIDTTGKIVIKIQFDRVGGFSEGLACFGIRDPDEKKGAGWFVQLLEENAHPGKWGFIDKAGEILISAQFEAAEAFSEGLAAVRKGKLWGYIDKARKLVIEPQFDLTYPFSEGLAAVLKGDKWGYIDKTGRMQIGLQFDKAYDFIDGLAEVWQGGKMGYILPTGKFFWGPSK